MILLTMHRSIAVRPDIGPGSMRGLERLRSVQTIRPATPSWRTSAAGTTNSPPTPQSTAACQSPSLSSRDLAASRQGSWHASLPPNATLPAACGDDIDIAPLAGHAAIISAPEGSSRRDRRLPARSRIRGVFPQAREPLAATSALWAREGRAQGSS